LQKVAETPIKYLQKVAIIAQNNLQKVAKPLPIYSSNPLSRIPTEVEIKEA
jgi:hypothetical protein